MDNDPEPEHFNWLMAVACLGVAWIGGRFIPFPLNAVYGWYVAKCWPYSFWTKL